MGSKNTAEATVALLGLAHGAITLVPEEKDTLDFIVTPDPSEGGKDYSPSPVCVRPLTRDHASTCDKIVNYLNKEQHGRAPMEVLGKRACGPGGAVAKEEEHPDEENLKEELQNDKKNIGSWIPVGTW